MLIPVKSSTDFDFIKKSDLLRPNWVLPCFGIFGRRAPK
jgi:hypothetical protein